jgi:hypothetical protein
MSMLGLRHAICAVCSCTRTPHLEGDSARADIAICCNSEATSTSADQNTRSKRGEREHEKTNCWTLVFPVLWLVAQLNCSNGHLHKNEEHVGSAAPSAQRPPIVISPQLTLPNSPFQRQPDSETRSRPLKGENNSRRNGALRTGLYAVDRLAQQPGSTRMTVEYE